MLPNFKERKNSRNQLTQSQEPEAFEAPGRSGTIACQESDVNYLDSGALWPGPPGPFCSLLVNMVYYTVQFLVDNTLSATLGSPRQHQLLKHGMSRFLVCQRDFKRQ